MKSFIKNVLIVVIGLLSTGGCTKPANKSLSLALWIAHDIDIAFAYAHLPDGRMLWREPYLIPYRASYRGWDSAGPVMLSFVKELPEYLMISWRLPSPHETPYDRCERRRDGNCGRLAVGAQLQRGPDIDANEDGKLIGPFKVPILSQLDPTSTQMLERGSGATNTLRLGTGIGTEKINFRWILQGTPPAGKTTDYGIVELGRGGNW